MGTRGSLAGQSRRDRRSARAASLSPPSWEFVGLADGPPMHTVALDKIILQDVLFQFLILHHAASSRGHICLTAAGSRMSSNGTSRRPSSRRNCSHRQSLAILEAMASARRPLGVTECDASRDFPSRPHIALCVIWKAKACCNASRAAAATCQARAWCNSGSASSPRPWCGRPVTQFEALSKEIGETWNLGVMIEAMRSISIRVESAWPFGLRFEPGVARAAALHVHGQAVS